jgi:tetratricopeptide (TPR) repeat protein
VELMMNETLPTFVLSAEKALLEGKYKYASDLCKKGIEQYPDYPIGFVLLVESYELSGDTDTANIVFSGARELFPYNKTINSIAKRHSESGRYSLIEHSEPITETEQPKDLFNKFKSSISQTGFIKPKPEELPEEIDDLTEQNPEVPASDYLAEILVKQGKIAEAIEMYLRLLEDNPEKIDIYLDKIESLKEFP